MNAAQRSLDKRAFSAQMAGLSALSLPFSGLALHLLQDAPLTGARHAWMAVHTALGFVFVAFGAWHVWLNRRPLAAGFRRVLGGRLRVTREARLALLILAALVLLSAGHAQLPVH
ncbi:DUF4405 domain-containing protein [bacterium]|nr:DUF4405 domain-containing protein [bacterium]